MNLTVPEGEPALYDLLQTKFGIGDWGPDSDEPWYKARNREIAKLRSLMRRRHMTAEAMVIAAWYAETNRLPIKALWQLADLAIVSKKAYRAASQGERPDRERLLRAAIEAHEAGKPEWADRLYNADPRLADDVLAQWEAAR